jgi:hypothetical protein
VSLGRCPSEFLDGKRKDIERPIDNNSCGRAVTHTMMTFFLSFFYFPFCSYR